MATPLAHRGDRLIERLPIGDQPTADTLVEPLIPLTDRPTETTSDGVAAAVPPAIVDAKPTPALCSGPRTPGPATWAVLDRVRIGLPLAQEHKP